MKLVRLTDAPPTASIERTSETGRSASVPWMTPPECRDQGEWIAVTPDGDSHRVHTPAHRIEHREVYGLLARELERGVVPIADGADDPTGTMRLPSALSSGQYRSLIDSLVGGSQGGGRGRRA